MILDDSLRASSPTHSGPARDEIGRSIRKRKATAAIAASVFFACAMSSIAITCGIVGVLLFESSSFFAHVSFTEFFTDTVWTPLANDKPHHGILPLLCGTLVTTAVALSVALPVGTIVAIYLSEFAPSGVREVIKPLLELLSAVPTVVYGFFALEFVSPLLKAYLFPGMPTLNMLGAGIVMGIMIIPYVSSLSEDAMRSVPMLLREGSYGMGANRLQTSLNVVLPAALSGIASAYVLGISRAIGETMIVAIAAGIKPSLTLDPRQQGQTITAFIVEVAGGESIPGSKAYNSLFAAGITLFAMTLLLNIIGYYLRKRFRQAY